MFYPFRHFIQILDITIMPKKLSLIRSICVIIYSQKISIQEVPTAAHTRNADGRNGGALWI